MPIFIIAYEKKDELGGGGGGLNQEVTSKPVKWEYDENNNLLDDLSFRFRF